MENSFDGFKVGDLLENAINNYYKKKGYKWIIIENETIYVKFFIKGKKSYTGWGFEVDDLNRMGLEYAHFKQKTNKLFKNYKHSIKYSTEDYNCIIIDLYDKIEEKEFDKLYLSLQKDNIITHEIENEVVEYRDFNFKLEHHSLNPHHKKIIINNAKKNIKLIIKGLPVKKRDTCRIFRNYGLKCLTVLWKQDKINQSFKRELLLTIIELLEKIMFGELVLEDLQFIVSMNKPYDSYENKNSFHLKCYEQIEKREPGNEPVINDRIPYIVINKKYEKQSICECAYYLPYAIKDNKLNDINVEYYIEAAISYFDCLFGFLFHELKNNNDLLVINENLLMKEDDEIEDIDDKDSKKKKKQVVRKKSQIFLLAKYAIQKYEHMMNLLHKQNFINFLHKNVKDHNVPKLKRKKIEWDDVIEKIKLKNENTKKRKKVYNIQSFLKNKKK